MNRRPQGKAQSTSGWAFRAGMRRCALGWRGATTASDGLKQATREIKATEKTDPVGVGEGVVVLAERISPTFEPIDTSTGALGTVVDRTLIELFLFLITAPTDEPMRAKCVSRLIDAIQGDGSTICFPARKMPQPRSICYRL